MALPSALFLGDDDGVARPFAIAVVHLLGTPPLGDGRAFALVWGICALLAGVSMILFRKRYAKYYGNRRMVPRAWRNDGSPVMVAIFGCVFAVIGLIAVVASSVSLLTSPAS